MSARWFAAIVLAALMAPAAASAYVEFSTLTVDKAKYKGLKASPLETDPPKKLFAVKFQVKGVFTLGLGSNGLDFVNDETRISFGEVLVVIPPGGLTLSGSGAKYQSKALGDIQQFSVKPGTNPGQYKYQIKAKALATPPPESLVIVIGDDVGEWEFDEGQLRLKKFVASASVFGYMVTGSPPVPLVGATIKVGSSTATTDASGYYSRTVAPGFHTISFPQFTRDGYEYAAVSFPQTLAPGGNDLGTRARTAHYLGVAPNISNGVLGANVVSISPPLGVGGTAKATLLSGSTVTLPPDLTSPQRFTVTEVPRESRPAGAPVSGDTPVMVVVGPAETTVSGCGDLEFPNPFTGLVDTDPVPIDFFSKTTGAWEEAGIGTVQTGATRIGAPGLLCEFGYYFPRCTPQTTRVVGTVMLNGVAVGANAQVSLEGHSILTKAPADLDGDGDRDNFEFPNHAIGCAGFVAPVRVRAGQRLSSGYISGVSASVAPVPAGTTDVGQVVLTLKPCGKFVGTFTVPTSSALAIDSADNVYVTTGLDVQKFSKTGTPLASWDGSAGAGGAFGDAQGIAIDDADNVFVTDLATQRVQRFDTSGTYVTHWDTPLLGPIAAHAGDVYVLEPLGMDAGISRFDTSGTLDLAWPVLDDPILGFKTPVGIASKEGSGSVYVSAREGVVRLYDSGGLIRSQWTVKTELAGIDGDIKGNVFLAFKKASKVQKYSSQGTPILGFGKAGTTPGTFRKASLIDVAVGLDEAFTLEDDFAGAPRVQRFSCP